MFTWCILPVCYNNDPFFGTQTAEDVKMVHSISVAIMILSLALRLLKMFTWCIQSLCYHNDPIFGAHTTEDVYLVYSTCLLQ